MNKEFFGKIKTIDRYLLELITVGGSVLLAINFKQLLFLPLVTALIFGIISKKNKGRFVTVTPINWAVFGLGILGSISLLVSIFPEETLTQVLRLFNGIVLFYAMLRGITNRARFWFVWGCFLLIGIVLVMLAPFSVIWNMTKLPFLPMTFVSKFHAVLADTVHPNVMAGNLLLIVGLALAPLLFAWKEIPRWYRILLLIAAVAMSALIIITKSRGAWIGFAALILIFVVLRRKSWAKVILFAALGLLLVGVVNFGLRDAEHWLIFRDAISGFDIRMEIWGRALEIIHDFAFTGIGMGAFGPIVDRYYPFFLQPPGLIPHAHNLFMQVAVDLGIPGLFFWLSIWVFSLGSALRVFREGKANQEKLVQAAGAALFASQIAMGIHGLTDAVVWGMVRTAPFVWILWALSITAARLFVPQYREEAQPNAVRVS